LGYNPNNVCVYLNAVAGCLAGLGRPGYLLDTSSGSFTSYGKQADAYGQEFDQLWGTTAPTDFQEFMILAASLAVWSEHSPLGEPQGLVPSNHQRIAQSVIARIKQGSAQVDAEGVSENCGGGQGNSGITLLALSKLGEATTSSGVPVDLVKINPNPFGSLPGSKLYVAASVNSGFNPTGTIDLVDNTTGKSLLASALSFTNQGFVPLIKSVALASPMVVGDDISLQGSVFGGESPQLLVQSAWVF